MKRLNILIVLIGLLCSQSVALAKLTNAEFIKYCGTGSYENIERMIKEGADVNASPTIEERRQYKLVIWNTPLDFAITRNPDENVVKLLIQHGANITNSDLSKAIRFRKSFDLIKFIAERISEDEDKKNTNVFSSALRYNNPEMLFQYLLSKGYSFENIQDTNKLLIEAVTCSSLNVVKLLIDNNANINYNNTSGSVLTEALAGKSPQKAQIVEYLIVNGANLYYTDERGATIVEQAARGITPECIDILLKHGYHFRSRSTEQLPVNEYDTTLLKVTRLSNKNPEIIQKLISLGANVNVNVYYERARYKYSTTSTITYEWETPLKNAVLAYSNYTFDEALYKTCLNNVKILLENGASIYGTDSEGRTVSVIDELETWQTLIFKNNYYGNYNTQEEIERALKFIIDVRVLIDKYLDNNNENDIQPAC